MITINLNTIFEVELTDSGIKDYVAYIVFHNPKPKQNNYYEELLQKIIKSPIIKLELWQLMAIFGPKLYNGCKIPFKNNIITKE